MFTGKGAGQTKRYMQVLRLCLIFKATHPDSVGVDSITLKAPSFSLRVLIRGVGWPSLPAEEATHALYLCIL